VSKWQNLLVINQNANKNQVSKWQKSGKTILLLQDG
jgi:hypothetical protein